MQTYFNKKYKVSSNTFWIGIIIIWMHLIGQFSFLSLQLREAESHSWAAL